MKDVRMETSPGQPEQVKRRSFFGRALVGGASLFTLGGILNLLSRPKQRPETEAKVTVRINPNAVPRTSHDLNTHG